MKSMISSPLALATFHLLAVPTLPFTAPSFQPLNHCNPRRSFNPTNLHSTTSGDDRGFGSSRSQTSSQTPDHLETYENRHDLHPNLSQNDPRSSEFTPLSPLPPTSTRLTRLESESRSSSIYIPSGTDPYWDLLDEISRLEADLSAGREAGISSEAEQAVKALLRRKQAKDPEYVYRITSGAARAAERLGREEEARRFREESARARRFLPQFNLEGLWVGKYGSHGFEMINVTYTGDKLIAYKVTGDQNIPRGEITFTADLTPQHPTPTSFKPSSDSNHQHPKLDPIILSESSSKKWGTKRLPRFHGRGHAAEPNFQNPQFMEGQLVVIGEGDYFSFAWIPLEHQIFFGRPSPELTLKMLREGGGATLTAGIGSPVPGADAEVRECVEYAGRCLEVTSDVILDEMVEGRVDPFSCIWHGNEDLDQCYFE
mmetsp:Transcript_24344/g.50031  ORF Transcript_24344/g.50031 Transcript_24344/m.50031 type:complete len:429 (+) Transcript_24344:353-1639(+)